MAGVRLVQYRVHWTILHERNGDNALTQFLEAAAFTEMDQSSTVACA